MSRIKQELLFMKKKTFLHLPQLNQIIIKEFSSRFISFKIRVFYHRPLWKMLVHLVELRTKSRIILKK